MARDILFRGFSENLMQWIVGSLDLSGQSGFDAVIRTHDLDASYGSKRVNPESVGQFTGLTDKNSVKIFEGDCGYLKGGKTLMVVEWTEQGCYKVQSPTNKMHGLLFCDFESSELEVIGNVFENPELIGAQNAKTIS